ncbi:hypothetical protein AB0933_27905 [Streptomyces venezuelae]|uniref:hypothetical protein n=1 Tax=Streptomyces venezuelae TaxID=54571 RepID=UPI0034540651
MGAPRARHYVPAAGNGAPSIPRWGCTECGCGWVNLMVPSLEEAVAVEAELVAIPRPHLRNWWQPADPNPLNPAQPTLALQAEGVDLPTAAR